MFVPKFTSLPLFSIALLLSFLSTVTSSGQLAVNPNQTAAALSSTLAGPGITISSPVLTCSGVANGTFTVAPGTILGTGTTAFGINNGILLTTGKAVGASGLESFLANSNNGTAGDLALTTLAGATTHDACILEFDFSVVGDTVKFNYQFGSEEYNKSTCGPYNDAFAFFISGPGITGTQNMALVPGTNIPVTVNSVNSGTPGPGYTLANCTVMGLGSPFTGYYVDNTGGKQFTYKGYTTKLTAIHEVLPCKVYHLKITVADAGNALYDSGVFIEAGSLTTPSISGTTSACAGNTSTLSDPLAGGTWSSSNTSVATVGSSGSVVTAVSAGTATISYSFGPGCSVTTTFTVFPLPVTITGASSVCTGAVITLSDATSGGIWTSSNTFIATVNAGTGDVTGKAGGMVIINYTTGTGCTTSKTITVNPLPAAISGISTVCLGSITTLTDATPGGTWSSATTAVATIGSATGIVTGISGGTTIISYTTTGCSVTTVATIKTIYTGTLNAAICPGKSYSFGGNVYTIAGSYAHTFKTAYCDSIVTLNLKINPSSTTEINKVICEGSSYKLGGTTYTISGTYTYLTNNMFGCDSTITLHLIVQPLPPVPKSESPLKYCIDQPSEQLVAAGKDITWYYSGSPSDGTKTAPMPSTLHSGITFYYLSQTINGCESPLDTVQVIIYPAPDATITSSSSQICRNDTIMFNSTLQADVSYLWSFPTGTTTIKGSGTKSGPITQQFDTTGYSYVKLRVSTNGTHCTATDSVRLYAVEAPAIEFYSKHDVCLGDTVVVALSAITPGITKYVWDFGDATIISGTDAAQGGPFHVMWSGSGIHTIEMYGTVGSLCRSKNYIDTINVHDLPVAKIAELNVDNVCTGDSLWLSSVDYVWENNYEWTPEHFFTNLNQPGIYGRIEFSGPVTLTVTDPFGCRGVDQRIINTKSCCNVSFPTGFTPNADGANSIFRPITVGHHAIHEFRVANRWGQIVFETTKEGNGWNGMYNGTPQDVGVYFYYIKYDCNGKTMEESGNVTLIR